MSQGGLISSCSARINDGVLVFTWVRMSIQFGCIPTSPHLSLDLRWKGEFDSSSYHCFQFFSGKMANNHLENDVSVEGIDEYE